MARFLLIVWPYSGHIHPNIALARALRVRGHEVVFYTGAMARPLVEQEGFICLPFKQVARSIARIVGLPEPEKSNDWDYAQLYQRFSEHYRFDRTLFAHAKLVREMYRNWFLGTVPQQVMDLEAILDEWTFDVLVCDPFMWGPFLVLHEKHAIPVAIFSYFAGCLLPGPDVPPFALGLSRRGNWGTRLMVRLLEIGKRLAFADIKRGADRIRAGHGLGTISASVMAVAGQMPLYLVASAPEFDYGRQDLPASVHYVGPCLWDKPSHQSPPAWLDQLPKDRAVVYVTEGTAHAHAPILLRAAVRGLANLSLEVVMTTGQHRDPAQLGLGSLASNIWVKRWVPHSDLFPRISAIVSHGGSGTVLSALNAGLPLVVAPMQWDQLENAQRVAEAGAGLRLVPKRCTPDRLRNAVERVLTEPTFRQNAQRLAAAFRQYGGAGRAAELLEGLAEKTPSTKERLRPRVEETV